MLAARQEAMEQLTVAVAQQNAMARGCIFLPHGSRLFAVHEGWESQAIAEGENVAVCDTISSLEAAVEDSDVKVIFLPIAFSVTNEDIEKICLRNGATKTLFKEVKKS